MANYEQLFLLEVLVDRLKLLTKELAAFAPEAEDEPDTPVRIRVKFSDFPCFEITQDLAKPDVDKHPAECGTTPIVFSSGKSCMFPMDPEQLLQDLIKYPMAVTVFKKDPEHPFPDIIGQTKVPLGDYMSNIIKRAAEWSLEEPLSELIQDTFPLRNAQDQDVGTINMLIRLTCFGKTIITKFQIADNKKSFLFKNAKTQDYEFKCKKCMPGQPIIRPNQRGQTDEEEEEDNWDEEGMMGDMEPQVPCSEKEDVPERQTSNREVYSQGPGFQRHEIQGPGFTASMEVRYPDKAESAYYSDYNCNAPTESQSAPTMKKGEKGGKDGKRGKSLDKQLDIENGVNLGKPRRKKKSKFHIMPQIAYPGVILGHKYCVNQGPPIPAKNGWAWKTTVPYGMKWEERRGWRPGAYLKQTWQTIKEVEELRKMGKKKRIKKSPVLPDTRKTTVHVHRIKGVYHVTMNPIQGPDDKEPPEPVVYTLERPEDGSDASELELDLTVPDPPYPEPAPLRHQAQQFCEEDLPLILPKPAFIKKKKKKVKPPPPPPDNKKKKGAKPGSAKSAASASKGTGAPSQPPGKGEAAGKAPAEKGPKSETQGGGKGKAKPKGKKKGDDDDDVYPWDEWIMKLKCKKIQSPED